MLKEAAMQSQPIQWRRWLRRLGTPLGFLLLVLFLAWQRPQTFLTVPNIINITQQVSILGVIAFTMTIVMVMGDFDLSVGAMASLSGVVAAVLFRDGNAVLVGVMVALGVGMIGGLINGVVISYVGVSPFIATLGTLTIFAGLARIISEGKTISGRAIPAEVGDFARAGIPLGTINEQAVQIPSLTIVAFLVLVAVWLLLEQTVLGRRLYAIGGNREAARLGGVRVKFLRLIAFVFTGGGAALAGLMLMSRLTTANPIQGEPYMLTAIASVFLGMTMSEEGEPHVIGTLVGVLILGVLNNGLTQLGIDAYVQQVLTGAIIVAAVVLSSLSGRNT